MSKIIKNCIRCKKCGDVLESKTVHDFVPCSCFMKSGGKEGVAADGGLEYLRRLGQSPDDWDDLSVVKK